MDRSYLCVSVPRRRTACAPGSGGLRAALTVEVDGTPTRGMDDASLEDFLGGSERADGDDPTDGSESADRTTSEDAADSDADSATATADTASDPDPGPDPTHSTYGWTPGGAECADCGATVRRRWRDDGRFVCADCKAW